ncbi:MAG: class I SAM-dependent methyltransferase [Burkholderiales bacterium]
MQPQHELSTPSEWVSRFANLIPQQGKVLDLACGSGRHARYLAALNFQVEAVDNDAGAIQNLCGIKGVEARLADLEHGPWPYADVRFDGIVATNYLHRPLFSYLLKALDTGGVLIYETFAAGNERYGKPGNPDFLLQPGELLEAVRGQLRVIAYEDVYVAHPKPARVQRICARRENV